MSEKTKGSCLCGAVRFEIEGEFDGFFLCHCSRCRKDSGSAHASNLFATGARLTWLSGEDKVVTYDLPETRHGKAFCSVCGSALPRQQMNGQRLIVPAGSLDTPVFLRPNAHIFVADRVNWDENLDEVPRFDKLPG